jgi:hypothetical protein
MTAAKRIAENIAVRFLTIKVEIQHRPVVHEIDPRFMGRKQLTLRAQPGEDFSPEPFQPGPGNPILPALP